MRFNGAIGLDNPSTYTGVWMPSALLMPEKMVLRIACKADPYTKVNFGKFGLITQGLM